MSNPYLSAYRKASVDAATPEDTLLLLVNEAVRSAEASRLEQDRNLRRKQLDKCRRIVAELSNTLNADYGGEMAFNMLRLYMFITRRLVDALAGDDSGLPDALRILRHVRDTWVGAVEIVRRERGAL
jgi:flagellar protein FliS